MNVISSTFYISQRSNYSSPMNTYTSQWSPYPSPRYRHPLGGLLRLGEFQNSRKFFLLADTSPNRLLITWITTWDGCIFQILLTKMIIILLRYINTFQRSKYPPQGLHVSREGITIRRWRYLIPLYLNKSYLEESCPWPPREKLTSTRYIWTPREPL